MGMMVIAMSLGASFGFCFYLGLYFSDMHPCLPFLLLGIGVDDMFVKKSDVGIIAQEVQKVLPEAVGEREDGTLGVRYELLVPLLVESIKELKEEIQSLKS